MAEKFSGIFLSHCSRLRSENMTKIFVELLNKLGKPAEQKSENTALAIIYCMFLSFSLTLMAMLILLI